MASDARLHFLGHSTFLIELEGLRILTDPALRPIIGPLVRSGPAPGPDTYRDIDLVLISHLHLDHLDLPSIRLLGSEPVFVVPRGTRPLMERNRLHGFVEIAPGERMAFGGITIRSIRADHPGQRPPFGPSAPAMGFVLESRQRRIYFAGDTEVFPEMRDLGDVDIALLPIGGWGLTHGPGHMDPGEAAEATDLIRPRVVVPMHWGTFWPRGLGRLQADRRHGAAALFARHVRERELEADIRVALPGERVRLPRGPAPDG
jgi:L-ascorbate metabolism protein UlaG (beta-lactamase superfamily)